jgi:hypothetical protein
VPTNGCRCELCKAAGRDLIGFRKLDGEPYVEAYHVAPVAEPQVGALNSANVITVGADHIVQRSTVLRHRVDAYAAVARAPSWSART